MITIQGADRVARDLLVYASKIRTAIANDVEQIGKEVEFKIQEEFPELTINSEFNPSFPEYTIKTGTEAGGNGLVLCSVTGKAVLTTRERVSGLKGKGFYENIQDVSIWEEDLVNQYLNEAKERITSSLQMIFGKS